MAAVSNGVANDIPQTPSMVILDSEKGLGQEQSDKQKKVRVSKAERHVTIDSEKVDAANPGFVGNQPTTGQSSSAVGSTNHWGDISMHPGGAAASTSVASGSRNHKFFRSTSMLAADLWHPVPQGLAVVVNAIKDLKQSAAEVIRVRTVEITVPRGFELQNAFVMLTVQGPSVRRCRKWKPNVFGSFSLSLAQVSRKFGAQQSLNSTATHHPADGITYRTKETNSDVRVSRLHRRSGQLRVVAKVMGRRKHHRSKKQKLIVKMTSTVPMFLNEKKEIKLNFTPVTQRGRSVSKSLPSMRSNISKEDVFLGFTKLSVLEAAEVFDVKRCRPTRLFGLDEWRPNTLRLWRSMWSSTWKGSDLKNPSALLWTMTTDMKHDCVLMYQTLFSQSAKAPLPHPDLPEQEMLMYDRRVLFLKRLILCFAVCKLTFCIEENGAATHAWKFPLASTLCHGNRVLIRLDGVTWQEFLNFLLLGDPKGHVWFQEHAMSDGLPEPLRARSAATHAVHLQQTTSQLFEEKLKVTSISQTTRNLMDGRTCHHLGLDLPIGGFGNQVPSKESDAMWIGQAGVPYRVKEDKPYYLDEIQHGHMYIRWDDFGIVEVPVMKEDPGSTHSYANMAHNSHPAGNGTESSLPTASAEPIKVEASSASSAASTNGEASVASVEAATNGEASIEGTQAVLNSHEVTDVRPGRRSCLPGPLAGAVGAARKAKDRWLHLPQMRTMGDLEAILKDYGYQKIHDSERHKNRLFRHLVEENELSIAVNQDRELRCRGVLIHLLIERENEEGQKEVLLQEEAHCLADNEDLDFRYSSAGDTSQILDGIDSGILSQRSLPSQPSTRSATSSKNSAPYVDYRSTIESIAEDYEIEVQNATHHLNDRIIPTMLRRRHESWTEAVSRLCQSLDIPGKATDIVIETCRDNEDEMCIYKCEKPDSHCHHLQPPFDIEYQAYRFKFTLKSYDKHHFKDMSKESFLTAEKGVDLDGFGGHPPATGTIWRRWRWHPMYEATQKGALGLFPPEDRLHIVRETDHLSSILLGIESSAPHKENFFGDKHNAAAKSKDTSPFGTRKWRDYREGGQEVPADIGGMHVSVDKTAFKAFQALCNKVNLSAPSQGYTSGEQGAALRNEKDLFKELLQASDEEIGEVLHRRLGHSRPVLHGHAGTLVFDAFIRDRTSVDDADDDDGHVGLDTPNGFEAHADSGDPEIGASAGAITSDSDADTYGSIPEEKSFTCAQVAGEESTPEITLEQKPEQRIISKTSI